MNTFSIAIPSNNFNYIKRTFESIQMIEFDEKFEIVIIDNTFDRKIINNIDLLINNDKYTLKCYHITDINTNYDINSPNIGYLKNIAFNKCTNKYIIELDHDDIVTPNIFSKLNNAIIETAPDMLYSNTAEIILDKDKETLSEIFENIKNNYYGIGWGFNYGGYYITAIDLKKYGVHNFYVAQTPNINKSTAKYITSVPNHVRVWKKSFYNLIGGHDIIYDVADDYELILKTIEYNGVITKINEPLYIQILFNNTHTTYNDKIQQYSKYLSEIKYNNTINNLVGEDIDTPLHTIVKPIKYYNLEYNENGISVVIPISRKFIDIEENIEKSIKILSKQNLNWELCIVCDNLDNEEYNKYLSFLNKYTTNIRIWNLETKGGGTGSFARNYALRHMVKYNIIAYLDDDNYFLDDHFKYVDMLYNTKYNIIISSMKVIEKNETYDIKFSDFKLYRVDTSTIIHLKHLLYSDGYWNHPNVVGYATDYDFINKIKNKSIFFTKKPTLSYNNKSLQQDLKAIKNYYNDQNE